MNGFTSADMSTAANNGHRDGYQAGYADAVKAADVGKPAAAQEAVAWQVGDDFYTSESLAIEGIQQWGPSGAIAIPLYAAPVAAAPVDPSLTLHDRVEFALRDAGFDLDEAAFVSEAAAAANESTPAAPGIDVELLIEIRNRLHAMSCRVGDEWEAEASELQGDVQKIIDSLIDASPKGGNTDPLKLPCLSFAVFDEFGVGADDRVADYGRACAMAAMQSTSAEVKP